MGPEKKAILVPVSPSEERVLVQKRWKFGSMTGVWVITREEAVWVLLWKQYGS